MKTAERHLECTIPILPVSDLARSTLFYTETLGFSLDWISGSIGSVSRDRCAIILRQITEKVTPVWVWIGLEDDTLFQVYRERGVKVLQEPKNWSWAYEMKFEDIDGNVLWLGTEPRNDLPKEDEGTHRSPQPTHDAHERHPPIACGCHHAITAGRSILSPTSLQQAQSLEQERTRR